MATGEYRRKWANACWILTCSFIFFFLCDLILCDVSYRSQKRQPGDTKVLHLYSWVMHSYTMSGRDVSIWSICPFSFFNLRDKYLILVSYLKVLNHVMENCFRQIYIYSFIVIFKCLGQNWTFYVPYLFIYYSSNTQQILRDKAW